MQPMNFRWIKKIINFLQSHNISYKQEYCYQLCAELEFLNKDPCNCSTNTSLGNVRRDCWFNKAVKYNIRNCTNNYFDNFIEQRNKICPQYCPLECDSVTYTFSFRNYNRNYTQLLIYFEELKYAKHSEIPKTQIFNFISHIGGILGLFIGCSFVSFFELAEVIFEICFILCKRKLSIQKNEEKLAELKRLFKEMNKLKKQLENISDEDEKTQLSTDQQQDCELKSKFSDYDNCETSPEDQIILNKLNELKIEMLIDRNKFIRM